jgi:hypothetical protein
VHRPEWVGYVTFWGFWDKFDLEMKVKVKYWTKNFLTWVAMINHEKYEMYIHWSKGYTAKPGIMTCFDPFLVKIPWGPQNKTYRASRASGPVIKNPIGSYNSNQFLKVVDVTGGNFMASIVAKYEGDRG